MRVGFVLPLGEARGPDLPASGPEILAAARDGEAAGFDSLWVFDHLLMLDPHETEPAGTWEAWTLMAALAAATERARLGTIVTCTGFRPPALLAKMAHTVHEMSGGRLILGVGAGWHEPEYIAFGYPFDHRFSRFEEALTIIIAMLREGRSDFRGKYYTTKDCRLLPPATLPPPPILIGTRRTRMLALTAAHADAYNTAWHALPGPRWNEDSAALRAACEAAGRDPSSVMMTVGLMVRSDDAPADAFGVPCDATAIADALHAWQAEGVDELILLLEPPTRTRTEVAKEALRRYRDGG